MILWFVFMMACDCDLKPFMSKAAYAQPAYQTQFKSLPDGGLDVQSEYSHILVRDNGSQRSLYFVRDTGEVVLESSVDVVRPYDLLVPYTQVMMATHLFRPKSQAALLIGVGGGGMLHYMRAFFPEMAVDAVDIDPVIIDIAQRYFSLSSDSGLSLHTADGFAFIADGQKKYDIVFMDAFLKPSVDTDPTGTHLRLKTLSFYTQLKERLKPNGVVAFNINPHPTVDQDIATIKEAFSQVWVVPVPTRGNTIVFASTQSEPITWEQLKSAASALDKNKATTLSYSALAGLIQDSVP